MSLCEKSTLQRLGSIVLGIVQAVMVPAVLVFAGIHALQAQEPSGLAFAIAMEQQLIATIEKAERSVVAIARVRKRSAVVEQLNTPRWETAQDPTSPDFIPNEYGTGVVIDAEGYVLTTAHVLGKVPQNDYFVWLQRKPYRATVKASDPWMDLAILKIDGKDLTPIKLGDASKLKKGNIVVTLGNPYAIARDGEPSASWGIVSNLARQAPSRPTNQGISARDSLHNYGTLIQTDAKLNFGTSGGALLNLQGQMVGLTTSLTALNGVEGSAGFAIPVNEAMREALKSLKQGKSPRYGFLGIEPLNLSANQLQAGERGIRVGTVIPGTPASAAGLRQNDRILEVDGQPISNAATLVRLVSEMPARAKVRLLVQSGRQPPTDRVVELGKKFLGTSRTAYAEQAVPAWRGLTVDFATAIPPYQLDARRSDIDPNGCVVVTDVQPDSPAWRAGLRQYTFITHVQASRIRSPDEFYAMVNNREQPTSLRITVPIRGKYAVKVEPN